MGEIDGIPYTNSLEAWRRHYERGCRSFEVDLMTTSDGQLIALHRGRAEALGLPSSPTRDEFMTQKLLGSYTPLDADSLAELLVQHPGWKLITDFKGNLALGIVRLCAAIDGRGLRCNERVMPQVYSIPIDIKIVGVAGFDKVILALYGAQLSIEETLQAARDYEQIVAVTMRREVPNDALVSALKDIGVATFIHTVNDPSEIEELLEGGVHGVMTDERCGS